MAKRKTMTARQLMASAKLELQADNITVEQFEQLREMIEPLYGLERQLDDSKARYRRIQRECLQAIHLNDQLRAAVRDTRGECEVSE